MDENVLNELAELMTMLELTEEIAKEDQASKKAVSA